jgi:large subunit ribosomal protein L9
LVQGRREAGHRDPQGAFGPWAAQIRQALESRVVTITAKAGSGGRLFGAVTPADIAEGVVAVGGPQIDKRKVELTTPIKSVGDFSAKVRLHDDVSATVKIKVVAG